MFKRPLVFLIAFCLLIVMGWYGYHQFFGGKNGKQGQMPPTFIETEIASQKQWQKTLLANGTLTASEGIMLTPEVSGRVTGIYITSGQFVTKGTPLVQLYPDLIQAQLDKAKALFEVDSVNYSRLDALYKKGFYDKFDLDKAKGQLDGDKADVDLYQAQLDQRLIKAPFDGMLGIRKISLGDYLNPGDSIISLQAIDPIRADFSVPDIYVNQIKVGNKVVVTSRALTKKYIGSVMALNSKVNEDTRTLDVRSQIPNTNHELIPGTYVQVIIYLGQVENQFLLSQDAIAYDLSGPYVYKVVNNHAVKTAVKLGGKLANNQVIVIDGVSAGDVIITAGQLKLFDGAPVAVKPASQPPAAMTVNS